MALSWGEWHAGGCVNTNGMRLGIDPNGGSVPTTSSSTFTFNFQFYTQNQFNFDDDLQRITWSSGGNCGNSYFEFRNEENRDSGTPRGPSLPCSYTYGDYGVPHTVTVGGSLSLSYNCNTPSHSVAVAVPPRPFAAPNAPTSFTATRGTNDTYADLAWTLTSTAQRPVHGINVHRSTWTGSGWETPGGNRWVYLTQLAGTARSYKATGLSSNHKYSFLIVPYNTLGTTTLSVNKESASNVFMTPAAPSNGKATVSSDYRSITVTWQNNAYLDANNFHRIERSVDNGNWTQVKTEILQGTTSWTDTNLTGGKIQYKIYTHNGSLLSTATTTAIVDLADVWVLEAGGVLRPAIVTIYNGTGQTETQTTVSVV